MSTPLTLSMTSGVFVECVDTGGRVLGQAVFTDWQARPLPGLGDSISVVVRSASTGQWETFRGLVRSRHFEVQREDDQPSVWVRIGVVVGIPAQRQRAPRPRDAFSVN